MKKKFLDLVTIDIYSLSDQDLSEYLEEIQNAIDDGVLEDDDISSALDISEMIEDELHMRGL